MSQLDLSVAADVSSRHISFLESGRSNPSEIMVLRLMTALDVPLREQNQALAAAGFSPRFPEPELREVAPAVEQALTRMLEQQEPYPLTVLSVDYDIVRHNRAADALFRLFAADPTHLPDPLNLFCLMFDPRLARPFVQDWEGVGHRMLARLHRESLQHRGDDRLVALLDRVLRYPGVPPDWQRPDFTVHSGSTLEIRLRRGDLTVGFLTTLTVFSAPMEVTLEEMRIESYFPLDEETRATCERWATAPAAVPHPGRIT